MRQRLNPCRRQFGGSLPSYRGYRHLGGSIGAFLDSMSPFARSISKFTPMGMIGDRMRQQKGGDLKSMLEFMVPAAPLLAKMSPMGRMAGSLRKIIHDKQTGGYIAVFRGARDYQYGRGFGDILRSIGKFAGPMLRKAVPVLLKTGKKLVKTAIKNREQGQSWGQSFREGIAPAAHTALKELTPQEKEEEAQRQEGSGRCRKRAGRMMRGAGCRAKRVYKRLVDVDVSGRPTHFNF